MTISSLDVGMGIALWPSSDPQRGKSDGGVGILGKQKKQEETCVCPSVHPSQLLLTGGSGSGDWNCSSYLVTRKGG